MICGMSRVAAVTGGAGAIGGAIAERLRTAGHEVAVLDRRSEFAVDLADEAAVRDVAKRVLDAHGRCDVLVHAAADLQQATLEQIDGSTWRHVQAVNVEAAVWLCQTLVPQMAQRSFGRVDLHRLRHRVAAAGA